MSIGERITELRKMQNLSQGQLAQAMDVSRQAVSKWENDQTSPDSLRMIRLAEVLDTDIEYLTTGRRSYGRRPPVVLKTVETVEKVVEKPVVQVVEKVVEKTGGKNCGAVCGKASYQKGFSDKVPQESGGTGHCWNCLLPVGAAGGLFSVALLPS